VPAPLLALVLAFAAPDTRLTLLGAMGQEVERAATGLRLDGYEPPYFVAFQVREVSQAELAGRSGAVVADLVRRDRRLAVDLRVGSYQFDSSGGDEALVLGGDPPPWSAPREGPLDDDPAALRQALWLLADERYKEALASYFRKRSRDVYRPDDPGRAASFSRETPVQHVGPALPLTLDAARWRRAVREASAAFLDHPHVFDSQVRITADRQIRWLATSEGTRLVTEQRLYAVHMLASARAPDGQLLEGGRDFYAADEAGLPDVETLRQAARTVADELKALMAAPAIDPYTGPAILEPEAAGVLFHEVVGHRLEGERLDDDKEGQTFQGQIGQLVLPPFLTVVDDPTLRVASGTPLNGAYRYDEQGIPGQRTVLIEQGKLVGFLLSRRPVNPFHHSNGHGRSQGVRPAMARMSSLVIESSRQVGAAELKRQLMAEARRQGKPYGLVIRDITGGNTNTQSWGYQAFKGTPRLVYRVDATTGAETLVRGVELVGTPLASISRILSTGDTWRVFNGYCGAESGYVPTSTVAPSVLVGELELQRVVKALERGPVLPSPWQSAPSPRVRP
jgi:predicted Zn-dependent protease